MISEAAVVVVQAVVAQVGAGNTVKKQCPCNPQVTYEKCCGPYLTGEQFPATAEALMRSRYTAYTQANIPYIQATMRGRAAQSYDPIAAEQWAKTATWKHLKVLRAFPHAVDTTRAYVEFVATFISDKKQQTIAELSEFQFDNGQWYSIDRA